MKKIISKVVITVSVVALLVGFNASKMPTDWDEYVVGVGDTVCDIAIGVTPNDEDYRKTEHWITEKNNIEGASIYPGQVILVPVCE